ncbi:hypothetical protein WME73_34575 [Sorangium sp. So ce302]|uniref:hypothetical protein n=1 Tax=unclassified Sorangium TaxID=2621164 RepID=UPI003F5EB3B8
MDELTGRVISARDLLPREHARLAEHLEELPTWDARFDLIERALGERVDEARIDVGVVSWAFRQIEERGGAVDMRALARELAADKRHVAELLPFSTGPWGIACQQDGHPSAMMAGWLDFHPAG